MAEETNAVERYLLDEFTPEERVDFEAHLFDCAICGDQARQSAIAIENVKQVFREEDKLSEASRQRSRNQGWAAWFRMPALIPSMVALALAAVVGYQNWMYIPALEQPQVLSSATTIAPAAREAAPLIPMDVRQAMFFLSFDLEDASPQVAYRCEFRREGEAALLKMNCDASKVASSTLGVLLPTKKFPAGPYTMILRPAAKPEDEIQRYNFVIKN